MIAHIIQTDISYSKRLKSNKLLKKYFLLFHVVISLKLLQESLCSTQLHEYLYICLQSKIVFHIAVYPLAAIPPVINIKNPIRTFFKFLNTSISEMHRYRFIDFFLDKTLHHIFKRSIFLVVWLLPFLSIEIIYRR
jgi:hypothetical protein